MASNELTFEDFLKFLPEGGTPRASALEKGIRYVETSNPSYVKPRISLMHQPPIGHAAVSLLIAPAAVGKSTLAAEIAFQRHALLCDLSQFQVGTNSLTGTLVNTFLLETTNVLRKMIQGDFLIILDALDEAQLRSGPSNFEAFLNDIKQRTKGNTNRPTVLLLARGDTADLIAYWFEDNQVPTNIFRLEFFDQASSVEFVGKHLDKLAAKDRKASPHRTQVTPYKQCLGELFGLVYGLLGVDEKDAWNDQRVRSFLGYAPVLETAAKFLNDSNFIKLKNELSRIRGNVSGNNLQWKYLHEIVTAIVEREQGKVQSALQELLDARAKSSGWSAWNTVYNHDEQCLRVLCRYLGTEYTGAISNMPASLSGEYEAALREPVDQHPFLLDRHNFANVVFREYLFAWGLANAPLKFRELLRTRLIATAYRPASILGNLFLSLSSSSGTPYVKGEDFGIVYDSLCAQCFTPSDIYLQVWSTREGHFCALSSANSKEDVVIGIDVASKLLHFWWRLGVCDIALEATVLLGIPGQGFLLGPESQITCKVFSSAFNIVEADVSKGISIQAKAYISESPTPTIQLIGHDKGKLRVAWPDVTFPWVAHYAKQMDLQGFGVTEKGWKALRKFLLMFRRQRARQHQTVHGTRWSTEEQPIRDRLLELATKRGVLSKEGQTYIFMSPFDTLMNVIELKQVTFPPHVVEFLREYFQATQEFH